jgi:FKBP-type peptidyl-prolyl cis-trans isomerase 2
LISNNNYLIINKNKIMEKIKNGDTVSVNYTGRLEDGTVFDTSLMEGRTPLTVTMGQGQLIKGFENGLIGMGVGESKTIEINPEDAYGQINEEAFVDIPKDKVPENVEVGMMLQTFGPAGVSVVKVLEINEETIKIDANHPLAGKRLIFDVEVLSLS